MKSKVATGVARRLLMTVAVIALCPLHLPNRVEQMERIPNLSLCSIIQVTRTSISCLVSTTDVSSSAISVMALLLRITATCWFQKITTQWRTSPTCRLVTSQTQAIGINNRRFPDIVGFWKGQEGSVRHSLAQPYRALKRGDHTHVVRIFPDGESCLRRVRAELRSIDLSGHPGGSRGY
jgi:hypothetical protein